MDGYVADTPFAATAGGSGARLTGLKDRLALTESGGSNPICHALGKDLRAIDKNNPQVKIPNKTPK